MKVIKIAKEDKSIEMASSNVKDFYREEVNDSRELVKGLIREKNLKESKSHK